ncbi:MAG: quinoprotein dehydrogenase-associated putative ABC transporter substrate-binding protein [Methylovulum sp.]|jgi:quinoprotein dehydrogenase-associated probable ABC transporter substrate-binding protein|nr:quinoprotein dehydrogenase-associated putative ABC transporter substrate-binding protein [Methylovulum sp.]
MSKKTVLAGLWLALFSLSVHAENILKVCADPLNPPYSSKQQDGFENKIAQLFADDLKQTLQFYWFPQRIGFIRNTLTAAVDETAVEVKEYKCDVVMSVPASSDMTLNTTAYYRSTYVLMIAQGRGWDDITESQQLAKLSLARQDQLKIAMFDRSPGTAWLQKQGLLAQGISYQSMTGDDANNTAMQIAQDFNSKKIDMVILWGPMAAYVAAQSPAGSYALLPMKSSQDIAFDFSMAMGVRKSDKDLKQTLDKLIVKHKVKITEILTSYHIPLLPLGSEKILKDKD